MCSFVVICLAFTLPFFVDASRFSHGLVPDTESKTTDHSSDEDESRNDLTSSTSPLRVEPAEIDLGKMSIGSEKSFTAILRNTSAAKATIGRLRSGCACLDLQVGRLVLEPGATTELSGRFRAGPHVGAIHKRATLEVQAPDLRIVKVPFTGKVVATLVVEPESVTLHPQFVKGIAAEYSVTIRNVGSDLVQLTPGKRFEHLSLVLSRETLGPGESATARITAEAEFVSAETLPITINTSHPHEKTLLVVVAVAPNPQLRVTPKVLRLGTLTKRDFLAKPPSKVLLLGADIQEFDIEKVDCPSFLRAELPPPQSNRPREILFHGNDRIIHGPLTGFVEIKIEHKATGKASVVKIPVSGTISGED